jgi:hypothetical protein
MSSLQLALESTTQTKRHTALQQYLRETPIGQLSSDDSKIFKDIFHKFYTPDLGEKKYNINDIEYINIKVCERNRNNKCFRIKARGIEHGCSIKFLAGKRRSKKDNVTNASRADIMYQINDFKNKNPLIHTDTCPVKGIPLGYDAQVDHIIPYHELLENFIKENNINIYSINVSCDHKGIRTLEEPYKTMWCEYHKKNAKLRWLSKAGNKISWRN